MNNSYSNCGLLKRLQPEVIRGVAEVTDPPPSSPGPTPAAGVQCLAGGAQSGTMTAMVQAEHEGHRWLSRKAGL